jgi:hypothetical protein
LKAMRSSTKNRQYPAFLRDTARVFNATDKYGFISS